MTSLVAFVKMAPGVHAKSCKPLLAIHPEVLVWTPQFGSLADGLFDELVELGGFGETVSVHPLKTSVSATITPRACLILRVFALSRRMFARLRRANNGVCCVKNARSAFFTQHTKTGERRRREQAIVMETRQTPGKRAHFIIARSFL